MNFKFQILDLIAITTGVAAIVAAYQADLILFRQLLCITLVAVGSSAGVLMFSGSKRKAQFAGAAGGIVGGLVYLAVSLAFSSFVYSQGLFSFNGSTWWSSGFGRWMTELPVALILSLLFGATIGPLLAMRFSQRVIPPEFKKPFVFSLILISGIFLLGIFAMFDRRSMAGRDWVIVSLVLSVVFVIHTNEWLNRFQTGKVADGERQAVDVGESQVE